MTLQAIILAGGKGTRLMPYTMNFPKPLVPVGNYPILEIIIRQLRALGFEKVTVLTGHLAELIMAYFGNGERWGIEISYIRETSPLNTAGALKLLTACEDHFLVMNGDILTTLNYRQLHEEHLRHGAAATVSVVARATRIDLGVVETDSANFLTGYQEKPTIVHSVSMGVYVLSRACRELIAEGESIGMPDLLLRVLANGGRVYCAPTDTYWLDIGRVDDYETAQREVMADPKRFLLDGD